jgi:hypothetical protein
MKKPTKMGRPPIGRPRHKARQLGRVEQSEWDQLREYAESLGLTFTHWALETLCREAKIKRKLF